MVRGRPRSARRRHGSEGEVSNERWLLTYSDMITLLMALFMVLFSISSVNVSKYKTLQQALRRAFSGSILSDGKSIAQAGRTTGAGHAAAGADTPATAPPSSHSHTVGTASESGALQEISEFARLKRELDAYAAAHGFSADVHTTIETRGLVIRVLTDRLLFPSGQASLIPQSFPLLGEIAHLLNVDRAHPIAVEGNTDSVPIQSSQFPSNWELSTARASTVVRFLLARGVAAGRLSAAGYADQRPIASNSTAAGRARNRRVEIVLQRIYATEASAAQAAAR